MNFPSVTKYELSSETQVGEKKLKNRIWESIYEDKEANKRITVHSWWVADGYNDVAEEFDIVNVEDITNY